MNTEADVEEICYSLERAVLRYFPRPIENIENTDTFVFAKGDTVNATQLTLFSSRHRTQPSELKRGLSFVMAVL